MSKVVEDEVISVVFERSVLMRVFEIVMIG